jgi:hypothetical protein
MIHERPDRQRRAQRAVTGLGASGNGIAFGAANVEAFTEWQWVTSRDRATGFPF